MSTYQYRPLDVETGDIRLLELHRGKFDDPIKISIFHTPFGIPDPRPPDPDRLKKIQETLPPGWRVFENLEGRLIFANDDKERNTWVHPNPDNCSIDYEAHERPIALCRPAFEALSYAWGDDNPSIIIPVFPASRKVRKIRLFKGEIEARVVIRGNLYGALKHLRKRGTSRFLWIDAICINQHDPEERDQQVRRMGDIYRFAERVVVWLGLSFPRSGDAMGFFGYVGEQLEYVRDSVPYRRHDLATNQGYKPPKSSFKGDVDRGIWLAAYHLLSRPWFDRLWVMQEILLANRSAMLQCGNETLTWHQMRLVLRYCTARRMHDLLSTKFGRTPEFIVRKFRTRKALTYSAEARDPLDLLKLARGAACSDPRDKVLALLGLLPPVFAQRIHSRYDKPALDVYREAFQVHLECTGSLSMLDLAGPSWIPDLTRDKGSLLFGPDAVVRSWSTGFSKAEVSYVNSKEIKATGMVYDAVEAAMGPLSDDDTELLQAVRNVWLKDLSAESMYPTGISPAEGCAWVLYHGLFKERYPLTRKFSLRQVMAPFLALVHDPNASIIPTRVYSESIKSGSIFKTANGYFGFSYRPVLPDDVVCVLLGCPWPVILRKKNNHQFTFVGTAYVHGLVDGEALLGPLPTGYNVVMGRHDETKTTVQTFVNTDLGTQSTEDPRLGPLPPEWESIVAMERFWGTKKVNAFRNKITGEVIYSDPRLLPDALKSRGVHPKQIRLCHQDFDIPESTV